MANLSPLRASGKSTAAGFDLLCEAAAWAGTLLNSFGPKKRRAMRALIEDFDVDPLRPHEITPAQIEAALRVCRDDGGT